MIKTKEYQKRRTNLIDGLLPSSIVILAGARAVMRSNDTDYAFRQNSHFYYLTGFPEPEAYLILSNLADKPQSMLFCLPKDREKEIWQGRRIGPEQAAADYGLAHALSNASFESSIAEWIDGHDNLYWIQGQDIQLEQQIMQACLDLRNAPKQRHRAPNTFIDISAKISTMRQIKSPAEIELMQKACDISIEAHRKAICHARDGIMEYELQAELEHHFRIQGGWEPAYGSIVASGENACILHYTDNNQQLNKEQMVLIDAGVEFQGYAADITRTFPVSGKFNPEQASLYQLVLDAQCAAIEKVRPNAILSEINDVAVEILTQGLIALGLLTGDLADNIKNKHYRNYYMHGIGHWLGMDVHDVGHYREYGKDMPLKPGMVITIEPGLYIAADAQVDRKWRGIGIRIEDDLLVTETGHRVMTQKLEKTIEDIERLMLDKSCE
jgi:Xaa-Pro aminopeptidase